MAWTREALLFATERYQAGDGFETIARQMRRRGFACARIGSFGGESVRRRLIQKGVHSPKPIRNEPIDAWLRKHIQPDPTSSCELWTGRVNEKGYGTTGDRRLAHRAVWEQVALRPLKPGEELHHTCRNRRCVKLDHLLPVEGARLHAILHRHEAEIGDLPIDRLADITWLFTDEQPLRLPGRIGATDAALMLPLSKIGRAKQQNT